jgi:hypothetical protein
MTEFGDGALFDGVIAVPGFLDRWIPGVATPERRPHLVSTATETAP